jgi:ABC-type polysaccharide/polyol phosphate transport system ATPase subunit
MSSEIVRKDPVPPRPSDDVVLSVRDVGKVYRVYSRPHHRLLQAWDDRRGRGAAHCFEVPAVRDVSFDLTRGDGISIIGRNGSGKSTLLEMLAGTLQPTSGEIRRVGRVSALLELGAGFNPDFTGRQNFRMSAAIQGLTERQIDEIEEEVEAFAEIGPFIDEPVRTYSSGMYVRLAFAAAVHVFPDLLIVDEALAVGDIFFQQKCFEFIDSRLADTAKVIVTHDLASAVRLSSRCLVMDRGEVVFDGEPLAAVEAYTALNLRERSTRTGSAAASARPVAADSEEIAAADDLIGDATVEVETDRSTAPSALTVHRLAIARRDGDEWTTLDPDGPIVHPGDRLRLQVDVTLHVPIDEPVWGYLMRDRVGNALFGQNSVGSDIPVEPAKPGRQVIEMVIEWPEVEQGDYTLTVGLGDGQHPLHHSIVAWAQGLVRFICIPHRAVHGAFNNDLRSLTVRRLGGG